jgi:gamma-aminobutyric acid type B receptor
MLSFGGDYTSIGALPGVQIALDYINNEPSILPGYSLHYTLTDSQCSRSIAQKSFFHQINSEPPKVGWVGSGCSTATEPTAEITQFYNITQVSCVSSSPTLNNRMRLRYYFQLLAEEVGMARGFLGLIRRFGWRRVGIITQNENLFTATMDALKKSLSEYGIDYLEKVFTTSESIGGLRPNPFEPHIRIYVFAMYSLHARALICEAYKRGIVYPKYQLLVYGWYSVGWWRESDSARLDCSQDQLNSVLPHAMGPIQAEFYSNLSLVTEGGLTAAEFEKLYYSKISSPQNKEIDLTKFVSPSSGVFSYAQQCHEATLALAMALHNTSTGEVFNVGLLPLQVPV